MLRFFLGLLPWRLTERKRCISSLNALVIVATKFNGGLTRCDYVMDGRVDDRCFFVVIGGRDIFGTDAPYFFSCFNWDLEIFH